MDTQAIRAAFLNAPEKTEDVIIPDWLAPFLEPETDLAIKDVPGNVLSLMRKQAQKNPDQDDATTAAAIICKCLMNKATGELIFSPTDRDAIAGLGSTKLDPLYNQIARFFGFTASPVADAKKN
jgi:hypothetical protein